METGKNKVELGEPFQLIKKHLDEFIVKLIDAVEKEMGCYFICHDEPTLNVSDSGGTVDMLYEEHNPDYPEIIDFVLQDYLMSLVSKEFGKATKDV